ATPTWGSSPTWASCHIHPTHSERAPLSTWGLICSLTHRSPPKPRHSHRRRFGISRAAPERSLFWLSRACPLSSSPVPRWALSSFAVSVPLVVHSGRERNLTSNISETRRLPG